MIHPVAVHLGRHARDRMQSRTILESDIEWALKRRIGQPVAGTPGTIWVKGYASGMRILKVCLRADDHEFVITVAWES